MRFPLLLLALLAGCSGGPGSGFLCPAPTADFTNETVGFSGAPVQLRFSVGSGCDTPNSVDFSVYDPADEGVPNVIAELAGGHVTVTFTPIRGGIHHVAVRFQPNLGLAQAQVYVAHDRSGTPALVLDQAPSCSDWELLASGLLVCLSDATVWLPVNRSTVELQKLAAFGAEAAGDVLWTELPLMRWTEGIGPDGGRGFSPDLDAGAALGTAERLLATPDDAVLVTRSGGVTRISRASDGGYTSRTYSSPFSIVGVSTISRAGNAVFTAFCNLDLEAGDGGCRSEAGPSTDFRGHDKQGIWYSSGSISPTLVLQGPGFETVGTLDLRTAYASPRSVMSMKHSSPVVDIGGSSFTPVMTSGVEFEYWGEVIVSATPTTVVTAFKSGTPLRFYRR